jgi:hypothetical protein
MGKPNGYMIRAENVETGKVVKGPVRINNIQAIHIALANHGYIVNSYRPVSIRNEEENEKV